MREEFNGSNPHSNGDVFSRSLIIFFDKIEANIITIVEIKIVRAAIINKELIIYINKY